MIVGLALLHALETDLGLARAEKTRPAIRKMLDHVLASANSDGMLYNTIVNSDLSPRDTKLSDNWGYVYGAVYTFYQTTGEEKYRQAVRKVLRNLPKYRGYDWEAGSMDGYADSIESAIYLVAREPVEEAQSWIESEIKIMLAYQQPRRSHRTLVRRRQLEPHGAALRHDEDPRVLSEILGARRRVGRRPTGR